VKACTISFDPSSKKREREKERNKERNKERKNKENEI